MGTQDVSTAISEEILPSDVAELIEAQGGVIGTAQASAFGIDHRTLARLADAERLVRISHAVYATPATWTGAPRWERYLVSVKAVGARSLAAIKRPAALSHVSAAALWDLPLLTTPRYVHISSSASSYGRRGDVYRHHIDGDLDSCERSALPVTPLQRTIADCAGLLPFTDAVAIADAGLARLAAEAGARREDVAAVQEDIREEVLRAVPPYRAARARRALAFADGRSESAAESKARVLMRAAGLPEPELQKRLATPSGTFFADLAIPAWGVLVEVDGAVKITAPYGGDPVAALAAERRRHLALQEEGWENRPLRLVRFAPGDHPSKGPRRETTRVAPRNRWITTPLDTLSPKRRFLGQSLV